MYFLIHFLLSSVFNLQEELGDPDVTLITRHFETDMERETPERGRFVEVES